MNYLVNGKAQQHLLISDRAVQYGDGLFETIAMIDNTLHNWEKHFQRLCHGGEILGLQVPDEEILLTEIDRLINTQSGHNYGNRCIIKIILSRGSGGRGYAVPEPSELQRIISLHPWPEYPQHYYQEGVDIAQLKFRLGIQSQLAGIKHLNRLEQVQAKRELAEGFQEALLLNEAGHIIEGVSSNIYFVHEGVLCMPGLKVSGIAGTVRAQIIELCQEKNIPYCLGNYDIEFLQQISEAFLSNSIIGVWPIKNILLLQNRALSRSLLLKPGPIYGQLGREINKQLLNPS